MLIHGKSLFHLYAEMDPSGDGGLSLDEFRNSIKKMTHLNYSRDEASK
jgi:hypothetical protein